MNRPMETNYHYGNLNRTLVMTNKRKMRNMQSNS